MTELKPCPFCGTKAYLTKNYPYMLTRQPAPGEAAESVPAECAVCNYIQAGCAIPSDIGHTCKPAATKENHNEL